MFRFTPGRLPIQDIISPRSLPSSLSHFSQPTKQKTDQITPGFYSLTSQPPKKPGLFSKLFTKKPTGPTTDDWIGEHDNPHIGKDLDTTHQVLEKQTGNIRSHPDFKQVENYTLGSKYFNGVLRNHGVQKTTPPETIGGINTTGLDNFVNSQRTQQSMTVYHGPGFHPLELAQRHPNLEFTNPGYTSTSINKTIGRKFSMPFEERNGKQISYDDLSNPDITTSNLGIRDNAPSHRHVLSINVPQGHPGVYVGNQTLPETEFLLPRNSTFRLRSTTPRTYVNAPDQKKGFTHVWDTDIVPQEK